MSRPLLMRLRRLLLMILLNLVLIAALLEGLLRIAAPSLPPQLSAPIFTVMTGEPYAQEWSPAWIRNSDHYYIVQPGLQNALQYGSPSVTFHIDTIELWEGGGIGFRNRPVDYAVDAVAVGDSFTFCFNEIEDCWVTLLGKNTGMGIVNLGQPVTGSISHELILRDFGTPYQAPIVIWQFFGNDFNDDYGLLVDQGRVEPVEDGDIERIKAEALPEEAEIIRWLRKNSALFVSLEGILRGQPGGLWSSDPLFTPRYRVPYPGGELRFGQPYELLSLDMAREANQIGREASRAAFESARERVAAWGGQMLVILIPTREEVYAHLTEALMAPGEMDALRSARQSMLTLCDELRLNCLDLLDTLSGTALEEDALYFSDDLHLTPRGNAIVAETIQQWLDDQGWLPQR